MAVAGKVAITPKGEWNANTTYEKLDLVFFENASYVAIKPSTGVLPTDESFWMLVVQSAGGADLEAIISGTQQVGNAKTLDGHEAEYFAKDADLENYLPLSSKPTGTYTGNGSTDRRTIKTGGKGGILCIYSEQNITFALLTVGRALCVDGSNASVSVEKYAWYTDDGSLQISTANAAINADGVTYKYWVL